MSRGFYTPIIKFFAPLYRWSA